MAQWNNYKRNAVIAALVEKGLPMALVGAKYGISRQRVFQILLELKAKEDQQRLDEELAGIGKPIFTTYPDEPS